jgi:hypothetical protein
MADQRPTVQFPADQFPANQFPADQFPANQFPADQFPADQAAGPADTEVIDAPPGQDAAWPPFGAFADETGTGPIDPGDQPITQPVPAVTWQQPPPGQPWHAQHEKTGEWRTTPPEHLAYQHSPPAEVPPFALPYGEAVLGAQQQPTRLVPPTPPPWQVPLQPDNDDRRRRTGLWISVALTATLLLCGGGAFSAYLLLRDADGSGAPDPATAVNDFMTAVYTRQDAAAADDLVCREARDGDRLAARISQIKSLANEYEEPTFRWDEPAVSARTDERATVSVQLTLSTDDEKTAEQQLTFTTVRKTGWLVCEIAG